MGNLSRGVRKPVSSNPESKVNRSINFSCVKMFFTAHVLCSLSLVKLKTEGQTKTENLTGKFSKLKSKFLLSLG